MTPETADRPARAAALALRLRGWSPDQLLQLHPEFAEAVAPAIAEAQAEGLPVRFASGHRSKRRQAELRASYEARKKLFEAGELKQKPLPAALPGSSAHNWDLEDAEARGAGGGDVEGTPASLALDVAILDQLGQPIPSGGQIPLEQRAPAWQRWAAVVARYPLLRDGGAFTTPDAVHVELVLWDAKAKALRAPTPAEKKLLDELAAGGPARVPAWPPKAVPSNPRPPAKKK